MLYLVKKFVISIIDVAEFSNRFARVDTASLNQRANNVWHPSQTKSLREPAVSTLLMRTSSFGSPKVKKRAMRYRVSNKCLPTLCQIYQ